MYVCALVRRVFAMQAEPWWTTGKRVFGEDRGYGLVASVARLSTKDSTEPFRRAGDAAFPWALFAFFSQLYVSLAILLRFLGRNDGCSGRIPHSLKVCVRVRVCVCWCVCVCGCRACVCLRWWCVRACALVVMFSLCLCGLLDCVV
jgi:hypothetical protein